jgi:uncharacterized membrane protein YdbT with pleckstrin-like domain
MSQTGNLDPDAIDWLTFDEGEDVLWSGKPHGSSLVPALVVGVPLSVVLVGLAIIAAAYLYRENTQYVVTTDALYKKTGVLSRDVQRIEFGKVQNTSYSQGFFGSQFGYGNVDISTAGGSGVEMQFGSVPEPQRLQELINERVKSSRGASGEADAESKSDVLDDIVTELRAIRSVLEAREGQSLVAGEADDGSDDATVMGEGEASNPDTGGTDEGPRE